MLPCTAHFYVIYEFHDFINAISGVKIPYKGGYTPLEHPLEPCDLTTYIFEQSSQ